MTVATMRLGVVNPETWSFLKDLHGYLSSRYETTVFEPRQTGSPVFKERLGRRRLARDLEAFLQAHDVVFFEWASELLVKATHLPKRCAIVVRLHRYEMYTWAESVNWQAVDRVILVSEAKRREFARRFPEQAHKAHVVVPGISMREFDYVCKPFTGSIGTLCHVSPRKRPYEMILALAEVMHRRPGLRMSIAGDVEPAYRDYEEALHHLVARLGLQGRVTFEGPVTHPAAWYPNIDIFVSNSYSEGLQQAPIEAMATGCYTLSHEWAGAEELVPRECLYLTDAGLVEKVEAYCGLDADRREQTRRAMRASVVERFDDRRAFAQIDEIIRTSVGH